MVFIFSNSVLAKIIKFRITAIMLNRYRFSEKFQFLKFRIRDFMLSIWL
jgi:hypothetical protein